MEGFWLISYTVLWGIVALLLVCVFLLFRQMGYAYMGTAAGVARDGIPLGSPAPLFSGLDHAGRDVKLADLLGNHWIVLIFGRPLCPPCQALVPALNKLSNDLKDEADFIFLCQSDIDLARVFAEETHLSTPFWAVDDHAIAQQYKVRVSPFAFLLDPAGVVRGKGVMNTEEQLRHLIKHGHEHVTDETRARLVESAVLNEGGSR